MILGAHHGRRLRGAEDAERNPCRNVPDPEHVAILAPPRALFVACSQQLVPCSERYCRRIMADGHSVVVDSLLKLRARPDRIPENLYRSGHTGPVSVTHKR